MVGLANRIGNRAGPPTGSDHVVAVGRQADQELRHRGGHFSRHLFVRRRLGLVRPCNWFRAERAGRCHRHDTDGHRRRLDLSHVDGCEWRRIATVSFCDRVRGDQHDPSGVDGNRRRCFRRHCRFPRFAERARRRFPLRVVGVCRDCHGKLGPDARAHSTQEERGGCLTEHRCKKTTLNDPTKCDLGRSCEPFVRWSWEILRRSKPPGVKLTNHGFNSAKAARVAGEGVRGTAPRDRARSVTALGQGKRNRAVVRRTPPAKPASRRPTISIFQPGYFQQRKAPALAAGAALRCRF